MAVARGTTQLSLKTWSLKFGTMAALVFASKGCTMTNMILIQSATKEEFLAQVAEAEANGYKRSNCFAIINKDGSVIFQMFGQDHPATAYTGPITFRKVK